MKNSSRLSLFLFIFTAICTLFYSCNASNQVPISITNNKIPLPTISVPVQPIIIGAKPITPLKNPIILRMTQNIESGLRCGAAYVSYKFSNIAEGTWESVDVRTDETSVDIDSATVAIAGYGFYFDVQYVVGQTVMFSTRIGTYNSAIDLVKSIPPGCGYFLKGSSDCFFRFSFGKSGIECRSTDNNQISVVNKGPIYLY